MRWRGESKPHSHHLGAYPVTAMATLVLASESPRRRELLERFGVDFEIRPADVDESALGDEAPADLVARLAVAKAQAGLGLSSEDDIVVLGADTVVVLDGEILGKPVDAGDARRILSRLSARTHKVLTGVAVASRLGVSHTADRATADGDATLGSAVSIRVEVVATEVTFVELSERDIDRYVASGEPLDKAGAYGIQGVGGVFVSSIRGSHDNVVGLPLGVTRRLLAEAGIELLA